jgi:cytochrome c biogenesis protein CcdA
LVQAKPIGILYVGDPMAQVHHSIGAMLWIGYSIGAGVLVVVCVLAVPLANQLSEALRKLTRFAQKVGSTEAIYPM